MVSLAVWELGFSAYDQSSAELERRCCKQAVRADVIDVYKVAMEAMDYKLMNGFSFFCARWPDRSFTKSSRQISTLVE
jgi:hypothetical protein